MKLDSVGQTNSRGYLVTLRPGIYGPKPLGPCPARYQNKQNLETEDRKNLRNPSLGFRGPDIFESARTEIINFDSLTTPFKFLGQI